MKLFLTVVLFMVLVATGTVQAHPGRTDSSGGHTCRTNCTSWGLDYGEYHYHDSYASEPDYYAQGLDSAEEYASDNASYIEDVATEAGRKDGYSDGSVDGLSSPGAEPSSLCDNEVDFSGYAPPDFQEGFYDAYRDRCAEIYTSAYDTGYDDGYTQGQDYFIESQANLEEESTAVSASNNSETDNSWIWWTVIGFGVLGWATYEGRTKK